MTCIAATAESPEAILIAADSGQTEGETGLRGTFLGKLKRHPSEPVAWGNAGAMAIFDGFDSWMTAFDWTRGWEIFKAEALDHLAGLNGAHRRMIRKSGVRPKAQSQGDAMQALVVGWNGDSPEILQFDDRGVRESYKHEGFYAIGSGGNIAIVAHRALRIVNGLPPLNRLLVAVAMAAEMDKQCGPPLHVWRVTREAIEEVPLG
ncbi:MAG: hypothetical protein AB7J35_10390 [Dehalococcoidia bacterium]